MKTAILSVGTEILFGQIINTNTVYLSRELNMLGHDVMYHYTVGDNPGRLSEIIKLAFRDCDLVITTGGLGPTEDDLTKEVACETLNDDLILHEEELEKLKERFRAFGREMTDNNIKQAYFPSRASILNNPNGTAPGFILENDGKIMICMPGPPREMTQMFQNEVKPYLKKRSDGVIFYKIIHTYGIGESGLETELLDIIDGQTDPTVATYAKEGESQIRVASRRATAVEAEDAVNKTIEKIRSKVGKYIYSENDESFPEVVARKLIRSGITISAAESCTGGLFADALVSVPGISAVLDRSIVTYSNDAKVEELGVDSATLTEHGAVSKETANEMAEGLFAVTGSDICIAVTGIAGPEGGSASKPVGLVYIAVKYKGETTVIEKRFIDNGRKWIRNAAVLAMLGAVNDLIGEIDEK